MIIAIDGPSASGKSSVSRLVAEALNFYHVDTGSMYRALTWKVLEEGLNAHDRLAIVKWLQQVCYECDFVEGPDGIFQLRNCFNGIDPGQAIRSPRVEEFVSAIAAIAEVREMLVKKQRQLAEIGDLVVEGRDIGTVVFPEASFKFYLDADPQVRARRRAKDQGFLAAEPQIAQVGKAIAKRDKLDTDRAIAPLRVATDAVQIDTSEHLASTTADVILKHIRSRYIAT